VSLCSAMDCTHLAHSVESNRGGAVHSPQVSRKSGNIRSIIIHMGTDLDALGCGARYSLETARNTRHTRSPRSRGALVRPSGYRPLFPRQSWTICQLP
jgi:hypothetical protein